MKQGGAHVVFDHTAERGVGDRTVMVGCIE